MSSRFLASLAALVAFSLMPLVGQSLAAIEPWSPPRNPDGHADLQGIWTNATWTPLERPVEFVRQWVGNSIGHWEGDTLVVDTSKTRFRGTADKFTSTHVTRATMLWLTSFVEPGSKTRRRKKPRRRDPASVSLVRSDHAL